MEGRGTITPEELQEQIVDMQEEIEQLQAAGEKNFKLSLLHVACLVILVVAVVITAVHMDERLDITARAYGLTEEAVVEATRANDILQTQLNNSTVMKEKYIEAIRELMGEEE